MVSSGDPGPVVTLTVVSGLPWPLCPSLTWGVWWQLRHWRVCISAQQGPICMCSLSTPVLTGTVRPSVCPPEAPADVPPRYRPHRPRGRGRRAVRTGGLELIPSRLPSPQGGRWGKLPAAGTRGGLVWDKVPAPLVRTSLHGGGRVGMAPCPCDSGHGGQSSLGD